MQKLGCRIFTSLALAFAIAAPEAGAQDEAVPVSLLSKSAGSSLVEEPAVPNAELDPRERAVQLNEQGVALVFQGQSAQGIKKIKEALALDPQNTTIRYNLAGLYLSSGEAGKAARMMEKVLVLEPNDAAYLQRLAEAYTMEKEFRAAIKVYQRLTTEHEETGELLLKIGTLQGMLGDHQAAERSLRKAREELGDTAALLNNLGSVLLVLGNYKEALPLLKAAQEKDPSADTALSLAIAYESSGEVRQAKDWYLKARSLGAKGEELEQRISILESELSEKH